MEDYSEARVLKLTIKNRQAARLRQLQNWHDHFAWLPVWVDNDTYLWLETVRRKGELFSSNYGEFWRWEYQRKKK